MYINPSVPPFLHRLQSCLLLRCKTNSVALRTKLRFTAYHPSSTAMPVATTPPMSGRAKRIVLSFDGTGNSFQADTSDTNIVKLYEKFDRSDPDQFHYYQPGIGTYSTDQKSVNLSPWGTFRNSVDETIDQGFGTSFDAHIIQGYRFLMSYYDAPSPTYRGDKIYFFGFSRGAFTARFLARMINTIGILSKGNEEMVTFAYKSFQDYETQSGPLKTPEARQAYMTKFKKTFCRLDAKVFFLGIFDCVNSVGTLMGSDGVPSLLSTAEHIRHAVSIDERRVAFRPALLAQDEVAGAERTDEDIKEVFFAGNHGDVGGGWPAVGNKVETNMSEDPVQLSDIAFAWMVNELREVDADEDKAAQLKFNEDIDVFLKNFQNKQETAVKARIHDPLAFGGGSSGPKVLLWKFIECLPLKHVELINKTWKPVSTPNFGGTRDIPEGATFHPTVLQRMKYKDLKYRPRNQGIERIIQEATARKDGYHD